jgi:hypothetical protein
MIFSQIFNLREGQPPQAAWEAFGRAIAEALSRGREARATLYIQRQF